MLYRILNLQKFFFESFKGLVALYLIYITIIVISSLFFGILFSNKFQVMDVNNNIILENISFEFGELISNLFNSKGYYHTVDSIKYYFIKLPALPFLILFVTKLSTNFYLVVILKNIIIFSIYFFTVVSLLKKSFKNNFLILVLVTPILIPYNYFVALNYNYGDCLVAIFFPLLFISLISVYNKKFYSISIALFVLYFSKTTFFLIVLVVPFLIFYFEKDKKKFTKFLPLLIMILSILSWGGFGYYKTGKFIFGSTALSQNAYGLSFVFNKEFKNYYPDKSTDLIPQDIPDLKFKSEWDWYNYYNASNKQYLKDNFKSYLKDCTLKLKFIFFGINRDGAKPDNNGNYNNKIRVSMVLAKIIFNLAIILSLTKLIKNYKKIINFKEEFYFLSLMALNIAPHLIGWATSKHLVGILNISIIYLFFYINKYIRKIQ
jgi:hypothetical protein